MKIILFGYGKMGKVVEKIAIKRGHSVVGIINKEITDLNISDADVAIDFSVPSAAENNIKHSLNNNIPIVSGTTGWRDLGWAELCFVYPFQLGDQSD